MMITVVLGAGAFSHWRPAASMPSLRDPTTAEPWMVDALPGIGAKRLADSVTAIRTGHAATLQRPARAIAEQVFSPGATP